MTEGIIYGLICILQMTVFGVYLRHVLGFRRRLIWLPVCWLLTELISYGAEWLGTAMGIDLSAMTIVNAAVYLLCLEGTAFLLCNGDWWKKILLVLGFDMLVSVCETLLVSVLIFFQVSSIEAITAEPAISDTLLVLTQVIIFGVMQFIIYPLEKSRQEETGNFHWKGILLISAACLFAIVALALNAVGNRNFQAGQILALIVLIGLDFLCYYLYELETKKARITMEAELYRRQIGWYQEWYRNIQQIKAGIHALNHDIHNHFSTIGRLCRIEDAEPETAAAERLAMVRDYIDSIDPHYQIPHYDTNSGNMLIDTVIDTKKGYAASLGISVLVTLFLPKQITYDNVDMVILLGNLFDNAIEACRGAAGEKEIKLEMRYVSNTLLLHMSNSYNGALDGQSGGTETKMPKTTKQDQAEHGMGMQNIAAVVAKYGGTMEWAAENCSFVTDIMLCGTDSEEKD